MSDHITNKSSRWEIKKLADGTQCEGAFEKGLLNGLGVITLLNGSTYEGQFSDGELNGYGLFKRGDGMTYCGQFKAGQPDGYGLITFPDGSHGLRHQEGYFENFMLKKQMKSTAHINKGYEMAAEARQAKLGE